MKLKHFAFAIYQMQVAFMLMYLIKLATKYDPDLRPIELAFIGLILVIAMAAFMYHMTVVFIKPTDKGDQYGPNR